MITNKKIILIAPNYYNYHNQIIKVLKDKGNEIDYIEDKNNGVLFTLCSKSCYLLEKYKVIYAKNIIKKLENGNYDLMIVIGGKTPKNEFWEYVNKKFRFKKVLYQWDSYKNFDFRKMIPHFDIIKTFDSFDAETLGIEYQQLFYNKQPIVEKVKEDIDLLFIGIWHSDRLNILNQIVEFAEKNKLNYCFKVYYPIYMYIYLVYIKKHFKPSKFFIFKSIPLRDVFKYYQRAKCIIDINHPNQTGLTMRTIETIGAGKKLITTNSNIKNEEFYNQNMIQIIDREKIELDDDFFKLNEKYRNIEKLEISNWIDQLLK
jgi:hypothetical protein